MDKLAIDLGLRECQICIRRSDATILEERRVRTSELAELLEQRAPSEVILESSSEAFAVAEIAQRHGHTPRIIPSVVVRTLGVGARGVKNDRKDARATSLASCQVELPSIHVPSARSRDIKALMTSRDALVETRTKLVNTVRSFLRGQLESLTRGNPKTLPQRVRERLLQKERGVPEHIEWVLKIIEALTEQLQAADAEVARLAEEDEACVRLMTVPGVGPITSLRFRTAVDDHGRFHSAHDLESYFGLTPGEKVTGFKGHRTHLTKAGSPRVRFVLVQAAWSAMRTCPGDPMVRWAAQVARRRGRGVAAVALARKMAGILFAIWRDGTTYNPRLGGTKVDNAPAELLAEQSEE